MNLTLKSMLEMSKNLISSIQHNLREFAEKNPDTLPPDDITLHRRPNSAGALASLHHTHTHSSGAGVGIGEEKYFEDDGDENAFDPEDYAFTRTKPVNTAPTSSDGGVPSPSRSQQLTAMLHAQQTGSAAWPTKRTLLNSMESIICGELFVVDFYWNPQKTNTELIARKYVTK